MEERKGTDEEKNRHRDGIKIEISRGEIRPLELSFLYETQLTQE